ncbi:hypothetical protein D3C83_27810 [compost metagenome]
MSYFRSVVNRAIFAVMSIKPSRRFCGTLAFEYLLAKLGPADQAKPYDRDAGDCGGARRRPIHFVLRNRK